MNQENYDQQLDFNPSILLDNKLGVSEISVPSHQALTVSNCLALKKANCSIQAMVTSTDN